MKREPADWDKIFANCLSHKGLTSKIYNELSKIKAKNKNHNKQTKKPYPPISIQFENGQKTLVMI